MADDHGLIASIYQGWGTYQEILAGVISKLDDEQLALRPAPGLRSVGEIAAHIVGARARWFYQLMGEGGDAFEKLRRLDRRGGKEPAAEVLVNGLETTWEGMQEAIARWTAKDWEKTWPGDPGEPEVLTRQWVIWHLIEHDLHHGGEISIILGANGVPALDL